MMADRIEREIDEILSRLGDESPQPARRPIPIGSVHRRQPRRLARARLRIDPATLMFSGAAVMLVGLVLSAVVGWLIWIAFAGVMMFLAAFFISFARGWPQAPRRTGSAPPSEGVFWRDRYIRYDEPDGGAVTRIKRKFRR